MVWLKKSGKIEKSDSNVNDYIDLFFPSRRLNSQPLVTLDRAYHFRAIPAITIISLPIPYPDKSEFSCMIRFPKKNSAILTDVTVSHQSHFSLLFQQVPIITGWTAVVWNEQFV